MGDPLQYSCLGNPVDRGAWRAAEQRVTGSDTTEPLSMSNDQRQCDSITSATECRAVGQAAQDRLPLLIENFTDVHLSYLFS